ncbi:MAG: DUF922 domain-containing protein [Bacteroidetes bacterium]|nr:DUF922 domain-containing protein [Bacteroidota bacterium]
MRKNSFIRFNFCFILLLTLFSFQTDKNILLWEASRPLTWDDFKGKPERRFAAASTSYDILKSVSKKEDNSAVAMICAVFFKNQSWKKASWINDAVLAHEQKHFDIVELYARKLRKKIKEAAFKNMTDLENRLEEMYDVNDKEMDKYQDLYDEETDGSMNGEQQRMWQNKIMKEIKDLDVYKETSVTIKF